ncbi:family 1 glycosylhydrolase [Patescibacteria group bacterium]
MRFPKNFLWGAASSAHQVEGNNFNDWTEWEKKNAKRLAKKAKKYYQKWQKEQFQEMLKKENYISGRACDHYNRYEKDFDIAKSLNHNAHRFSIEWSRIEPEQGKFNQQEIEHYRKVILALKRRGIEPFVTLWHWTNPVWFSEKGGFEKHRNIKYFVNYAEKMVKELGKDVKFWITINEPNIYVSNSYLKGVWFPQKRNIFKYRKVLFNLIKAHKLSYDIIKNNFSKAKVGIAKNNIYFEVLIFFK